MSNSGLEEDKVFEIFYVKCVTNTNLIYLFLKKVELFVQKKKKKIETKKQKRKKESKSQMHTWSLFLTWVWFTKKWWIQKEWSFFSFLGSVDKLGHLK